MNWIDVMPGMYRGSEIPITRIVFLSKRRKLMFTYNCLKEGDSSESGILLFDHVRCFELKEFDYEQSPEEIREGFLFKKKAELFLGDDQGRFMNNYEKFLLLTNTDQVAFVEAKEFFLVTKDFQIF